MVVVGDLNELEFGSKQGDQSAWFIDPHQFRTLWDGDTPVFAVLGDGELKQLQGLLKRCSTNSPGTAGESSSPTADGP